MKKIVLPILFTLFTLALHAAPMRNVPMLLLQPNGDTLRCLASGDEYFNYLHDANGYTIMQHPATGYYVYALPDGENIKASAYVAGKADPVKLQLAKNALPSLRLIQEQVAIRRQLLTPAQPPVAAGASGISQQAAPNQGVLNNLVVFIRFSDQTEFSFSSFSRYNTICNQGATSMKTFYEEVSYGKLSIPSTFYPLQGGSSYVVSYQDSHPRNYYLPYDATTNPDGYQGGYLPREQDMLAGALNAVKGQVDPSLNLDLNNDGYVDNITFIIAGAPGPWSELLWPHRVSYFTPDVSINGKRVGSYILTIDQTLQGGVLCHEMFHSLGAPDLYHYSVVTPVIDPVGDWDIMCTTLNPPQHMGAYMKYKYGKWIDDIPAITAPGKYTLYPLHSSAGRNCYKVPIAGNANEFYVLEYRKKPNGNVVESSIPGSGIVIYRINTLYNGNGGYNGTNSFDEVYVFRLNGNPGNSGSLPNAYFSGDVNRINFGSGTDPYPFYTSGQPDQGNISISNVVCAGDSITFRFKDPKLLLVESIAITTAGTITLSASNALSAVVSPCNAANRDLAWSVTNGTGSAHISGNNLIGDSVGTVTLTATAMDAGSVSVSKTIVVEGIKVTSVSITVSSILQLAAGSVPLTAIVQPSAATDQALVWEIIAGTHCAHIDGNNLVLDAPGTLTLKATAQDGSSVSASKNIEIKGVPVTSIAITVPQTVLLADLQVPLTATVSPASATVQTVDWNVTNQSGSAAVSGNELLLYRAGKVLLKASAQDESGVTAEQWITIQDSNPNPLKARWANGNGADGQLFAENNDGISRLAVYSLSGSLIIEMKGSATTTLMQLSFAGLPRGNYIIRTWNGNGSGTASVKISW